MAANYSICLGTAGCGEHTTGEKGHVLRITDYGQR